MKIEGKVAVVVGGTTGIGWACVDALLQNEAKVCFGDVREDMGKTIEGEFNTKYPGKRALYKKCDVSELGDIQALMDLAKREFGQVEIFLNTAAIIDENNWERCLNINMGGSIRCTNVAIQAMGQNNGGMGGVVVLISSISGLEPTAWGPVYGATKWGMIGLTASWAERKNFRSHGIRFNCICPMVVDTPFYKSLAKALPHHADDSLAFVSSIKQDDKIPPSLVAEGFLKLVREDEHNGKSMRISKTYGIDFATFEKQPPC